MLGNQPFDTWQAAVAQFDSVFIEYFMQPVFSIEVFGEEVKESSAHVSFYPGIERWVVPDDASFSLTLFWGFTGVLQVLGKSTFS